MNERLKRILIISGFIVVAAAMFWVIYLMFFRPETQPAANNTNQLPINGLPQPSNGNINGQPNSNSAGLPIINVPAGSDRVANGGATVADAVVNQPAAGIGINSGSGNLQYYDRTTGKFYQLAPDGTSRTLMTDATYPNVQEITWDPNGNQAILTFPDDSKVLYDFRTKKQTTLPAELNDFSFSPTGTELTSKYLDSSNADNQWLMVSKPDGTSAVSVEQLGENASKVYAKWSPNDQVIATFENAINSDQSEIIFLGKNNENFLSAQVQGKGFIPNWSPDGQRLLYSTYSVLTDNVPHLYAMNGAVDSLGQNMIDLGLDTRADKCIYSQSGYTVYCAVPYYSVSNSGIQPSLSFSVPDNIYSIDLLRGSTTLVARPVDDKGEQRFSIGSLKLSTDETAIYFTDTQTGYVHRINLR